MLHLNCVTSEVCFIRNVLWLKYFTSEVCYLHLKCIICEVCYIQSVLNLHHTLIILLGIQFSQRYGHVADRFIFFGLWTALRPWAFRNFFWICSKSTLGWLMDGKLLSYSDDILILFMKMQRESSSRLGSEHQHKLVWRVFYSCRPFGRQSISWPMRIVAPIT